MKSIKPGWRVDQSSTAKRHGEEKALAADKVLVFSKRTPKCTLNIAH
jgi:hypothetical protein